MTSLCLVQTIISQQPEISQIDAIEALLDEMNNLSSEEIEDQLKSNNINI